ncbi:MAG TPA: (d)CMP kinase [Candidatus Krumholzibacteria bacterium]|nr:(d)CMP kinase [Candidatus Krumholzibacteria bacterium]HPD71570.1 (d)CMP kinase [Candidatus Krumholzibacteria bacterium]HRY41497.1 (d)CMP kinase [Candidatus Krumholzibacteria bacterium]
MERLPSVVELRAASDAVPADAVVAIDGPAGSGKSTTARALARRLQLVYVDTGAMYRALTRAALEAAADPADEAALCRLLDGADLRLRPGDKEAQVVWNGRDVSQAIRTPAVDAAVSAVSAHGEVRRRMVERQREFARRGGVVMEGRDIGSVVFPLATAKLYLDATLSARAERRWRQQRERGQAAEREAVQRDLAERDRLDSGRAESPLAISPDALVIDTSRLSLEQQIEEAALACRINPWLDARVDWDAARAWRALPAKYRLFYNAVAPVGALVGLRVAGRPAPTVPPGVILASNHISWFDPPLVGSTFRRGPVRTLAKRELFAGPIARAFFRWLDAIPIDRRGYDAAAFAAAGAALAAGQNLLLFPEGTRRRIGEPGPIKGGLGILAQETRAPILPIFVRGTRALAFGGNPQSPLEIRYGPLVRLHALDRLLRDHDRREVTERIGALFLGILRELEARSYAATPESEYERRLRLAQGRRDRRRNPFGETG